MMSIFFLMIFVTFFQFWVHFTWGRKKLPCIRQNLFERQQSAKIDVSETAVHQAIMRSINRTGPTLIEKY